MAWNKFPKQLELFGLPKEVQLSYVLRKDVVLEKLVDLDIQDSDTYSNQAFYEQNEKRLKWKLIVTETFYEGNNGEEDNKYYDCINLATLEVNNFDLAKELLFMDSVDLSHYVEIEKGWTWEGEDYEDICDYINFVEYRQDKYRWLNQSENWDSDKMNIERITLKELLARYKPKEHRYTMSDTAINKMEKKMEAENYHGRKYFSEDDTIWDRYV